MVISSTGSVSEKKIDFAYQTYMSLISENESIYTKIVCIAPKYVVVNKLNNRVQIAQPGSDEQQEQLEPGERREWYWADTHLQQKIVIKYDQNNAPNNVDMADKIR